MKSFLVGWASVVLLMAPFWLLDYKLEILKFEWWEQILIMFSLTMGVLLRHVACDMQDQGK